MALSMSRKCGVQSCRALERASTPYVSIDLEPIVNDSENRHQVIYLTGAPGVGKSTTAETIGSACGARVLSYGAILTKRAEVATQEELRERSAEVIASKDVRDLDDEMSTLVAASASACVIDSHALTVEPWGLRAIPFSPLSLARVGITAVACLYLDEEILRNRVIGDPRGRRILTVSELRMLQQLQASLALTYAHTLGVPFYLLDAAEQTDTHQANAHQVLLGDPPASHEHQHDPQRYRRTPYP